MPNLSTEGREKAQKRALACVNTDEEPIIFSYNGYSGNCEEEFRELAAILTTTESNTYNIPVICNMIKDQFKSPTVLEALSKFKGGVEEKVILMMVKMLNTSMTGKIGNMYNIPFNSFKFPQDILRYVDALIKSGVSTNTNQGIMFIMGNTYTGKTSLVHNIKSYIDDPSKPLAQFLTQDNAKYLETEILEVYKDIRMEQTTTHIGLKVEKQNESPHIKYVKFLENSEPSSVLKIKINVVDFGGHHEYNACSSLFVAGSGICFICFDVNRVHENIQIKNMSRDQFEAVYFPNIGNYVDMISKIACQFGIEPKIVLVATKVDDTDEEHASFFRHALDLVKNQLENLDDIFSEKQSVLLIDEVISTSSASDNKISMEELYQKVVSLYCNQELLGQTRVVTPHSWYSLLEIIRKKGEGSISIDEISKEFANLPQEAANEVNISSSSLENLVKLQPILIQMGQQFQSHKQTNDDISDTDESQTQNGDSTTHIKLKVEKKTERPNNKNSLSHKQAYDSDISVSVGDRGIEGCQASYLTMAGDINIDEDIAKILDFFTELGEVLWFKQIKALKNIVIPEPMELIKSLRKVINHKVIKGLKKEAMLEGHQALGEKGILSFKDLKVIYNKQSVQLVFSPEQTWNFLIQLGLGCKLDDEVLTDESLIFLPCLIGDERTKYIIEKGQKMEKDPSSICVQFSLDMNKQSLAMYYDIISILTKNFIYGDRGGGEIIEAFSEKIENRKLGNVGGIRGSLAWTERDIRRPEKYSFLLLEYDTDLNHRNDDKKFIPAIHKVVRFHLKRNDGVLTSGILDILYKLDELFTTVVPNASRRLLCKKCKTEDQGYFKLNGEFLPTSIACTGTGEKHEIDENILLSLEVESQKKKAFDLHELMSRDKESLGLEPFEDSSIRKKILNGKLGVGEQIWIYHDRTTNKYNPVARYNPYSHVVVYVGKTGNKHEVVHVTMGNTKRMILTQMMIAKEDVFKVIKPDDQVFMGHRIKGCQFSGNIRETIRKRALACVEPQIFFDYDYRSNCETFCNMVIFGIPHSTQSDGTRNWLKGLFKICNVLKYSLWCGGLPLRVQMEKRLIERDFMPSSDEYTVDAQQSSLHYWVVFAICGFLFAYMCHV